MSGITTANGTFRNTRRGREETLLQLLTCCIYCSEGLGCSRLELRQRGMGLRVDYDAASDTFAPATLADQPPQGNDAECGFACHTIVATKDYIFTAYPTR